MCAPARQDDPFAAMLGSPSLGDIERWARGAGYSRIIGADEAGRGPLAGPVVAAAVCLAPDASLPGLNDSKKLTATQRDALYPQIRRAALAVGVCFVMAGEIDRINILEASRLAMRCALERAEARGKFLADLWLIDGNQPLHTTRRQRTVVKGDSLSLNIAAASVLAKVLRDRWMCAVSRRFPGYGFESHKGYGTRVHLDALHRHGPSPIHRMSFAPVATCDTPPQRGE